MRKKAVVIWGDSGHSLVVSNIISLCGQYEIVGFLDNMNPDRKGEIFDEKTIFGGVEELSLLKQKGIGHVALGFGHCSARIAAASLLKKNDFQILTLIHPEAVISNSATIGEGTVVSAGVVIDPACKVGRYAIINNSATICHGSTIDDGVHISPGVSIGGNVHVGLCCWVGIGSCIIDHVRIGERSYIGAGSVVAKDIPAGVVAYGNPAKIKHKVTRPF
jgi:acetyltransferase EpsM